MQRDRDSDGKVMDGVRLARNAVVHGAVATVHETGLEYPLGEVLAYGPPVWVALDQLERDWPPKPQRALQRQREVYAEHIAGQIVPRPLIHAQNWFWGVRERGWVA